MKPYSAYARTSSSEQCFVRGSFSLVDLGMGIDPSSLPPSGLPLALSVYEVVRPGTFSQSCSQSEYVMPCRQPDGKNIIRTSPTPASESGSHDSKIASPIYISVEGHFGFRQHEGNPQVGYDE